VAQGRGEANEDRLGDGCIDALSEAFGASGSEDVAVALVRCRGPWGFHLDVTRSVAVVAVTSGRCWLRRPSGSPLRLDTGDLVLVPMTLPGYALASTTGGELVSHDAIFSGLGRRAAGMVDLAGNGATSSVIYATYEPASPARHVRASVAAPIVVEREADEEELVLGGTFQLLSVELAHNRPGAQTAVNRLVDVLVVHMLRAWMETDQPDRPAPPDAAVAAALERMHTEPSRRWTIGALAAEVGLSRAAFVRRFTAMVGEAPSTYLTRWRLATAARRLHHTTESLGAIAHEVGYSSEFTFSRAFRRAYGQPPGRYRTNGRAPAGHNGGPGRR
jgi:AraC-like DNA-binding protein